MSDQYIYVMHRLQKVHRPDKVVLNNISLSFLPGAKIGVLGANGTGKSTLLKIMAGVEQGSSGTAQLAPGATVGLLDQEPELDDGKDVRENIQEGLAPQLALTSRFEEISARLAEPMEPDEMEALLAEFQTVQDEIERLNAWDLQRTLDVAMDALPTATLVNTCASTCKAPLPRTSRGARWSMTWWLPKDARRKTPKSAT